MARKEGDHGMPAEYSGEVGGEECLVGEVG